MLPAPCDTHPLRASVGRRTQLRIALLAIRIRRTFLIRRIAVVAETQIANAVPASMSREGLWTAAEFFPAGPEGQGSTATPGN